MRTSAISPAFEAVIPWVKKGGFAILDQALFSGANFLVNILLARWLPPREYGAFAVALSIYYLLLNFHTAVLTEPMMVFGAGRYREYFRKYLGMLFYGHWGISAFISLILGISALVTARYGSHALARALGGLAIASPFLLLLWFARRACYVPMRPGWAVMGSGVNFALVVGGIFFFWRVGLLSSFSGLVLLGVSAGIASLVALTSLRPQMAGFAGNPTVGMVGQAHFDYGRWSLGTVMLMWVPGNIAYILLPIWAGLEGSAAVRALMNLILPSLQAMSAISLLIVPHLSALFTLKHVDKAKKSGIFFLSVFLMGALSYAFLILLYRHQLLHFLYKGKYDNYTNLLIVASILPVVVGINSVVGGALRAMERPKRVFQSYIFTALAGVTLGIFLIANYKVSGAVWSMFFTSLTTSLAMIYYLTKEMKEAQL